MNSGFALEQFRRCKRSKWPLHCSKIGFARKLGILQDSMIGLNPDSARCKIPPHNVNEAKNAGFQSVLYPYHGDSAIREGSVIRWLQTLERDRKQSNEPLPLLLAVHP